MSQTVQIDDAAKSAIAEIVGMPWEKDYYATSGKDYYDYAAFVKREGISIRILVSEEGNYADMLAYQADWLAKAIAKAAEDASRFAVAQSEWSREQFKKLNCEINGTQIVWGYKFMVNGQTYEVHFMTNEKTRTCVIIDRSMNPIFQKVTDDVSKVSKDDAAFVLKTFLQSKAAEKDE